MLSRGITTLIASQKTLPTLVPRGCSPISHMLYADDVFIFCRGNSSSIRHLIQLIEDYGSAQDRPSIKKKLFFLGKGSVISQGKDYFNPWLSRGFLTFQLSWSSYLSRHPTTVIFPSRADNASPPFQAGKVKFSPWRGELSLLSLCSRRCFCIAFVFISGLVLY